MEGAGVLEKAEHHIVEVARRSNERVVAQTLRSSAAATIAYAVATWLTPVPAPLLAPLTALLVVQVTLYATLTSGIRRVNAVVVGVLVATGFSSLVGLSWWSLGLLILVALTVGRLAKVDEFVPEVAISAMLVLGVTGHTATALDRVEETVIGAVVGEFSGAGRGLGYLVYFARGTFDTPLIFVALLALAVLGVGFYLVISWLEAVA